MTQISDRKFKNNIKLFANVLDKVMQVQVKTYDIKNEEYPTMNFAKGTQFGFITQELQHVLPELVGNGATPRKYKRR